MIEDLFAERIRRYNPSNSLEQENVLQELMQQVVLVSLSRAGFFGEAVFHGGTCLRILHGMNRFSEDLDFFLKKPEVDFRWQKYLERVHKDAALQNIQFELHDRSDAESVVKKAFIKTDSIGKILVLDLPHSRHTRKKIKIKLEIDTNPPAGSAFETAFTNFPTVAAITMQTLASGFGLKSHALLCRGYVKGRDWYDFTWYVSRNIVPDLDLLASALRQQGPWAGQQLSVTADWYFETLRQRIIEIDWSAARNDVVRFLPAAETEQLAHWNKDYFLYQVERLQLCPR